jgi:stage V sporulation protein B
MNTVYKTAFIVTLFSIAEKFLGFLYRIFLSHTIGSEGVGLYQITLSVFAMFLTIASSGIPVTVSRFITKYRSEGLKKKTNNVVSAGILVTILITIPITILLLLFPKLIGFAFADKRCLPLFTIALPALTINSIYSVFRGVFWGTQDFLPYSAIELIEETVMIIFGVILVLNATSIYSGAKNAVLAVVISYAVSFILGTLLFIYRGGRIKNPKSELKPLLLSSLPITAMRTSGSLVSSLISIILPLRLISAGYSSYEATSLFGAFFGMAMPLIYIPMSLIGPFTIVLIPKIAESFYKNDTLTLKKDIERALNFSTFLSALIVPSFICVGKELGAFLCSSVSGGIYTSRSAFLMILLSISSLTTSILNSLGEENKTLFSFLISNFALLVCIFILPKFIGIYSLLIGYSLVFGISLIMNLKLISKKTGVKLKFGGFAFLSVVFLLPTTILGFLLKSLLLNFLGPLLTIIIICVFTVIFYVLLHLVFGTINFTELLSIFKKKKRANLANKFYN